MNEIDGGGVRHARVRQPWKAGPQPRGLRLVRHEVRSTAAVPLHRLQGHAEYEHGDRVQRASLHPTGVRPRSQLTRRRREHFCDGPGHGPFPQHRRALARGGPRRPQGTSTTGWCAILTSLSCRLMSSARSLATRTRRSGCLRPSRYPPGCGPGASWAAAPIATPEPSSATSSAEGESSDRP